MVDRGQDQVVAGLPLRWDEWSPRAAVDAERSSRTKGRSWGRHSVIGLRRLGLRPAGAQRGRRKPPPRLVHRASPRLPATRLLADVGIIEHGVVAPGRANNG